MFNIMRGGIFHDGGRIENDNVHHHSSLKSASNFHGLKSSAHEILGGVVTGGGDNLHQWLV